jgi:putative two-component system response regulator
MPNTDKPVLLLVDDTPGNIDVLRGILSKDYALKIATSGRLALKIAQASPPDLILLDVMMPEMDGYEVCQLLKQDPVTRHVPIIFVTAKDDVEAETRGLALGAADYLTKPVSQPVVLARVKTHLALYDQRRHLEGLVRERTLELQQINEQLEKTRHAIITQLGRAAEYRDNETGLHIVRVGYFSKMLGLAFGFSESRADLLMHASMMHDVGKIGIPDQVLLKPGKLTPEEFEAIKKHPEIGAEIIGEHEAELLVMAREVALTHHEKWDGSGYPRGLKGQEIPVVGRIVAVADVFDALTTWRPYKQPWPVDQAFDLIRDNAGTQFDPEVVQLFLEHRLDVLEIYTRYSDLPMV